MIADARFAFLITDKKELALHKKYFDFLLSTTHNSLNVKEHVELTKEQEEIMYDRSF
ncbi:hypothetical protein [Candidatus Rhabdochlamydia porcellionis]|jgi:hypothetical protein|uniref:Uncharacterized protein n=1 Tax=Candidatus Rhabdochlamydia porcellionis TaxID=225148 RepID=A0ABX8Z048_9BACT|nr:hypothetical protein [Candidatus Rhabdochlamydia porcellionis]QZA59029.1 hypothetical protein RHAB15C_0000913 [Candidatus Rhabdochlamydia porcellionis]